MSGQFLHGDGGYLTLFGEVENGAWKWLERPKELEDLGI